MLLTVKQVADLTGVTIKTLYHYHKIGLLEPGEVTDAGYRLYGKKELERLQHILFYRELDFPLEDIQKLLDEQNNRYSLLLEQKKLMEEKQDRLELILSTINETIHFEERGKTMEDQQMFKGLNKEQWQAQLKEHNDHLKEHYQYEIPTDEFDGEAVEESAREAHEFMSKMAFALKAGWSVDDERVKQLVTRHIHYINEQIMPLDAKGFVESAWFFITDEFHKKMLEDQQIGLSYYLYAAAVNLSD
ncbi:DNA-binding transcriptional regulator, MerR family [Evansella caseinilytica]|uniref:DNA-binding transcriptional regulator, MerR family n=1 Tax=Evansella caseinilytica TaxID=1503961 RepID=A0A1H3SN48_9BACI|nr:MerR family transcriptional regulator [Evansella caseinilytica]SDZ39137.1 DNA-binding transcriptional regulator, MerR family [Evansella caseinilytica]